MAPVVGSSATIAPGRYEPSDSFIALYAARCAALLIVSWTLPPRGSRPVRISASFVVNSAGESPLRMSLSVASTPSVP